jgi:very-short-patch-repair endonuclease
VPTPESVQAVVDASLDTWKRLLLDLTRRNRALNFRPLKVSTIAIVDEQPAEVFRLVYDEERALTFAAAPEKPAVARGENGPAPASTAASPPAMPASDDPFDEEHVPEGRTFEPYASDALPDMHRDTVLQTTLEPEALDRSLRRIEEQARLSIEEQGVNTLFLALGLLHYTEAEASDEVYKAPLVLLPVSLRRESARSPFTLAVGDDEPMVNPALAELLRRQFNVVLPDLPSAVQPVATSPSVSLDAGLAPAAGDGHTMPPIERQPPTLQSFFLEVQARLAQVPAAQAEPQWKVTNDIYLGLFSFQKLVMYKDLEANAASVASHRLIHQLITRRGAVKGGGLGLPDDVRQARLDDEYPPEQGAHVVDADGSQQRALAAADRGYDLVVEGPPGTGKSQTITNLVAQALHAGKSVLFVAEKMAALDVVHQRLQRAGLGEFCLELHSTRSTKREVIKSIAAALDASLQPAAAPGDAGTKLPEIRTSLGDYVRSLHDAFGAVQLSPYAAYGELARVLDAPRLTWATDPREVTGTALDAAASRLERLAAAADAAGDPATHPWRDTGRTFYPQDQLDAIAEIALDVASRVPGVQAASVEATRLLGLPSLEALGDLDRVRSVSDILRRSPGAPLDVLSSAEWDSVPPEATSLIALVREVQRLEQEAGARFTPETTQVDHAGDIAYIETHSGIVSSLFWWLDARQRAIRARWTTLRLPGYTPSVAEQAHDLKSVVALRDARHTIEASHGRGLASFGAHWRGATSDIATLESYARWVVEFRQLQARESLPDITRSVAAAGRPDLASADRLDALAAPLARTVEQLGAQLQWSADRPSLLSLPLDQLHARASAFGTESARAARWGAFVAARGDVRDSIAAPLIAVAETGAITFAALPRAFLRAFWFAWLAACVEARPALARFQALTQDQRVREFRDLDRRVLDDNRSRLVASLRARVQTRLRDDGVEAAMPVLRREMAKQRNHRPIRETLQQADAAVRAIKPVFLMSPLSVAQFTSGASPTFDLVVFDEASQLPPEDAVGAIVRGAQLVVVGDPKQLPPTSFFASQRDPVATPDSEDGVDVPDAESILEAFMGCGVPMSRLKWHYRSAHESLISFSNVSFYDGDLLTFPSVEPISDRLGLRFAFVSDGVYEGKGLNLAEARRVADAVVAFAREQLAAARAGTRPASLGVGTFNVRQQLAIQDLLEERRRDEPDIDLFFDRGRPEPFFVKNLENIQGDERDVIFLSVTYAKGRDGRLRQNFGPLNGDNGWRRLNVLTTRARRAMRVFSSMRASDIQEGQSKGGPLLKAFLEYAESGRLDHPAVVAAAVTESPFEREVVNDLTRRGHLVQPQVGVAGYRIDIGVRDPDAPGRFLLGIECDGVAYHASDTARDRDRLRQQVLESRGWTIVRLWSTDWFKDRAGQMERLERAIAEARQKAADTRADLDSIEVREAPPAGPARHAQLRPSEPRHASQLAHDTVPLAPAGAPVARAYVKATAPVSLPAAGVLDCDVRALSAIAADVVRIEAPVHEDDVVTRVTGFYGQRAGARVRAHVLAACADAVMQGLMVRRGEFLWAPGTTCVPRDRSDTGVGADRIAPEEYDAAVGAVLAGGRSVRRDTLTAEARRLLGFERTGATLSASLDAAIDRLLASGTIGEASDGYRLRE